MNTVAIIISTVGYHWEELYDAYKEFKESGWKIDLFTVNGDLPKSDPKSMEKHEVLSAIGIGLNDSFSPETSLGKEIVLHFEQVRPISQLNINEINAIYLPGGHGCLFDVNIDKQVHQKILEAYQEEKILSAVCHGTSTFGFINDGNRAIVANKKMTGFPDALDDILQKVGLIHEKFMPMPFSNEAKMKNSGAKVSSLNFWHGLFNPSHIESDYPFVTGIGPKSAKKVAKEVIKMSQMTVGA